jgi:probable HAF family extracellular repeat protein
MTTKHEFTRPAARLALCLALYAALPAWSQHYGIKDLGTLANGFTSEAFGVNNFGRVVGVSTTTGGTLYGFYYDGTLTGIAPLNGTLAQAFDVNASGQVATMTYDLGANITHGIRWQAGTPTILGNVAPRGINTAGEIVGCVSILDPTFGWVSHAALWQSGNTIDLGTLGGHYSFAYALSDDDWIVGLSYSTNDTLRRATLWRGGVGTDLGTLGGTNGQAYDINAIHQVVGVADTATNEPHAFLYNLDANGNVTTRTDLGTLGGGYSYAYGVSDTGIVVGTSNAAAFVWQAGVMRDLNTLLPTGSNWRLDNARAVNNFGQIVGLGLHFGQPRAYLMTPFQIGDLNCNGVVGFDDINPFVQILTSPAAWQATYPDCPFLVGDINGNGTVGFDDINPFVALLTGP